MKSETRRQYFNVIRQLLIKTGVPNSQISPKTMLRDDLKLDSNDYYFLKVDIEELFNTPIDIDLVFESKTISDLVTLLVNSIPE